jgi:hypothetical protein
MDGAPDVANEINQGLRGNEWVKPSLEALTIETCRRPICTICTITHRTKNFSGLTFAIQHCHRVRDMSLTTILLIILVLALLGVLPTWPHSREWGYMPSGIVGVIVLVLLVLLVTGRA